MKYHIITYGCQMNKSDSERIIALLEKEGYKKASDISRANLIIINMCSVRQSAVDRVFGQCQKFSKLKIQNSQLKTLLTGCILKRDLKKFKKYFDFILPIKTLSLWPEILKTKGHIFYLDQRHSQFNEKFKAHYFSLAVKTANKFSALVPVSTGCDNFCTYCVVPFTRGPLICRTDENILKEAKLAIKRGAKEIWLLGQNVNDYYSPTNSAVDFPRLLEKVNNIPGNFWVRFISPHPKDFSEELINIMASCQKITPYLNLPVQSGDNEILKKMNRPYTVKQYKNLVKRIRKKIPNVALSTDVIVGFPGETKEQFENTFKLFKEIKYDMAFIAKYSPRTQTAAFKLKDNVSLEEKERRYKLLREILKKTALEKNRQFVGKKIKILVVRRKINNQKCFYVGKARTNKTVKFQVSEMEPKNLVGQFVKVKIIDASPWSLKGLTNY